MTPPTEGGDMATLESLPWRIGRKVGRTIYNRDDELIGMMDTPYMAALVVECVNSKLDLGDGTYA